MLSCMIGNGQYNQSTPLDAKFSFTLTEGSISLLSVSDSVVALLGYKAEDFLSKRISLKELIHPHDNDIADALFANPLADTSDNFNIRIRQANQRIRCITGHYKQRKNQLELFLQCAKSLSKITNDQTMMANFKAMMENTEDYIYFKDCNHVFTGASQTLVAITSPSDHWEDLLGLTDYDVFPEELADVYYSLEKQVFEGQSVAHEIQETLTKDGQKGWVDNRKYPIKDDTGQIIGLFGIARDITERKQAEEQLRKSEERFLLAMKASNDGLFDWNLETNEIYYSPAWKNMLGYEDHELPNDFSVWENTIEPEDAKKSWALHQKLITKQIDRFVLEFKMKHKDGHWVDILSRAKAIFNDSGKAVRMIGTHTDISERKQAEEALLESEKQISSIFRSAPVGIGSVVDRVLSKVNSRLCEMTGYDEAELIGQGSRMLYPSDEEFEFVGREKYAQIAHHGTGTVETRWQKHDGTIIDVLLSSTPVDLQNQSKGVTFTALEITERKQAEEALRESEERFKSLHNASFGGIAIHDQGVILECNQGLSEISGFSHEELIGRDGLLLISEKTRGMVLKNIREGYEKPYEAIGFRKNGDEFPIRLEARNIPYKGKSVRVVEFRDITEQKKQEAEREKLQTQLEQAQKMESIGRLAGGVAHDFNNMLGVILGYTELAMGRVEPDNPLLANLEKIQGAAQRSADLTGQLLAFARKQIVSPKVIDINNTIESILKLLRRLIGEDIDLAWRPGKDVWPIKIDPTQVDQILTNLCVNARDAIVDTGKVTIETGTASFDEEYCSHHRGFVQGDYVLLAVSDTGCGMDEETQSHLFEPFFTTKEMGKGTGLGLATVYGVVKQNNGFVNVYSEIGQGTTFKIYLPRHLAKTVPLPKKEPDTTGERGHETVLLVEDERAILEMTTEMLESLGYTVLAAGTPGEAVHLAHEHPNCIDLLLTDVVMPEMNGRDLAKNMLSIYPDIRRLFMSGYTANVIAHHGVLDEGVHFIQKPFSMKDLGEKLREALEG